MTDILDNFSAPVAEWFRTTFGRPTSPQEQAWPPIQRREHTLLLAPTGSGKTLAAFLSSLDELFRRTAPPDPTASPAEERRGIEVVYVSPLKALNNDIERNLRVPLAGIRRVAEEAGASLPEISVRVRSGDTPARERQAMLKHPPHILITTPESLYLMLTAPRARDLFRPVRTIIVDEIHTMAGSKRGVHLALTLERLERLADERVQRIGLSATIKPLEEVARFLGGASVEAEPPAGERRPVPRPVTVIDAGHAKALDLRVETVVDDFHHVPGGSIWPTVVSRVADLIQTHRTTLVFANSRRTAERTADWLNEELAARAQGRQSPLMQDGVAAGVGFLAARAPGDGRQAPRPIRAHHGSMAKEARLEMERDLKAGNLPALVGTSSLELGIDIGSVDLVVQLQSPKAVAQGLQRVGRSGHLVGQTSKGRILPTFREDVMESAVIAGGMLRGEVEETHTPQNALDVLAQQIVAMVSVEEWQAEDLHAMIRQAYPYHGLTPRAFRAVLEMLAGRYPSDVHVQLRPRLLWDRTHDRLAPLPGSRLAAVTNGGTITDKGTFGTYLPDGRTRIGELDEEFVYESRVGDSFLLGSQVWRILEITDDRVMVAEAPGAPPRMPFWHGDYPWRPYELGRRVGAFRREVAERLERLREEAGADSYAELLPRPDGDAGAAPLVNGEIARLRSEYALDEPSAWQVLGYVARQLDGAGTISSDRTILVERFADRLGEPRLVVHSPFGGRVNGPWSVVLAGALRERTGVDVEVQSDDDGIMLRFPASDAELPLDIVSTIGPEAARDRLLRDLPDSAVFGAQFRQNAARALLLPGTRTGKRTPFWLQRLRAKDLQQAVRRFADFPILVETYRDCLEDVMDLPHLEEVLRGIERGEIRVLTRESAIPSPVAQGLLMRFTQIYLYEWDTPKSEREERSLGVDPGLLQDVLRDVELGELLKPEALDEVQARMERTAPHSRARTVDELHAVLQDLADLSSAELGERAAIDPAGWIEALSADGRIVPVAIPAIDGATGRLTTAERWVPAEYRADYEAAFADPVGAVWEEAARSIVQRYLRHAGPTTVSGIRRRYALPAAWLEEQLTQLVEDRRLARGRFSSSPGGSPRAAGGLAPANQAAGGPPALPGEPAEYLDVDVLARAHRRSLGLLRGEVRPVPLTAYADFLARWQHLAPPDRLEGEAGLHALLEQLRGTPVPALLWERDVLPLRLRRYDPAALDALSRSGELVWVGSGGTDLRRARVTLFFRGEGALFLDTGADRQRESAVGVDAPADGAAGRLSEDARTIYALMREEGALFTADLTSALQWDAARAQSALAELVLTGVVTNDGFDALRHLLRFRPPAPHPGAGSSLEAQLAERRGAGRASPRTGHRPPGPTYRATSARVHRAVQRHLALEGLGRWTLVHRVGVLGPSLDPCDRAERLARQLLDRYGVVSRDHLDREGRVADWGLVFRQLERMEFRGEARRGYFVRGLPGIQFARAEALERLHEIAEGGGESADEPPVLLASGDPANLYTTGGPDAGDDVLRVPRVPSAWLVQHRGLPILTAEDYGRRLATSPLADPHLVLGALRAFIDHVGRFHAPIQVAEWNGRPIVLSPGMEVMEALDQRHSRLVSFVGTDAVTPEP